MFAYISKINNKDIIDYTHNMIRLYYNVDDSNDNDGEYLDSQDSQDLRDDEIVFREDITPLFVFAYN
jgi:hypothetical protein